MQMPWTPHLEILPLPQRILWNEFDQIPGEFILYGGTAIALHLGHRQSVDFDFFGEQDFNPDRLVAHLPFLHDAKIVQKEANTLSVPLVTLKALSYFDDGNLRNLPEDLKHRLVKAVAAVDPDQLPLLVPREGHACGRGWRYDG
ncbi:MAG: nucleotidyl transferase AbiEii/AbiGii toxin family protein [Magnetococcus sp. DMHC-1]|nr:nucleotidyl transferase AbiEii/AbiGii toxin family protein [Magnetococcales bacterium]